MLHRYAAQPDILRLGNDTWGFTSAQKVADGPFRGILEGMNVPIYMFKAAYLSCLEVVLPALRDGSTYTCAAFALFPAKSNPISSLLSLTTLPHSSSRRNR